MLRDWCEVHLIVVKQPPPRNPLHDKSMITCLNRIKHAPCSTKPTPHRGISLIRKRAPIGLFSRIMPRAICWSWGGWMFPMSEVHLYTPAQHALPHNLHPMPSTPHPAQTRPGKIPTLHPSPHTMYPTPCTLHPPPSTLHFPHSTLHPTPFIARVWQNARSFQTNSENYTLPISDHPWGTVRA